MRGGVTDAGRTNEQTLKIELLSQWKLEAEFRNSNRQIVEQYFPAFLFFILKTARIGEEIIAFLKFSNFTPGATQTSGPLEAGGWNGLSSAAEPDSGNIELLTYRGPDSSFGKPSIDKQNLAASSNL